MCQAQQEEQGQVLHLVRQTGAEIVVSVQIESLSVLVRHYIIMKLLRNILDIISQINPPLVLPQLSHWA